MVRKLPEMPFCLRNAVGIFIGRRNECVGTAEEYRTALAMKILSLKREKRELPLLLRIFDDAFCCEDIVRESTALSEYNRENLVPEKFSECLTEMYSYVSNN